MTPFEWIVVILLVLLLALLAYLVYGVTVVNGNLVANGVQNKTIISKLDRVGSYSNDVIIELRRVNANLRGKH